MNGPNSMTRRIMIGFQALPHSNEASLLRKMPFSLAIEMRCMSNTYNINIYIYMYNMYMYRNIHKESPPA